MHETSSLGACCAGSSKNASQTDPGSSGALQVVYPSLQVSFNILPWALAIAAMPDARWIASEVQRQSAQNKA